MSNPQPGEMLGPYQIIKQIGKGGMATVYKAYHAAMDRYVAVKVLPHEFMHNELFLSRFRQEVRLIAKLEHKHILPVHDYGESGGVPFLVMRFLDSGTLKDRIQAGPLSLAEVDHCFNQLAEALAYAHSKGVIHRDIKPSNALLDETSEIFLTDFGIAKIVESTVQLTMTGAITGTPAYMSPEQGQGLKVDHHTDIYSLGVVLYEMVTGRVPFEAETPMAVIFKKVQEPLPPPSVFKPDIDPGIESVLLKALAKQPNERFASIAEFQTAWRHAIEALSRHPAAPTFTEAETVTEQGKTGAEVAFIPSNLPQQPVAIPAGIQSAQRPISISGEIEPARQPTSIPPGYYSRQPSLQAEELPGPQQLAPSISWKWVLLVAGIGGLLVLVILAVVVGGSLLSALGSASADTTSTRTYIALMVEKTVNAQQTKSFTSQPVISTIPAQTPQVPISTPTKQPTSRPVPTQITDPLDVRSWGQLRDILANVGSPFVTVSQIAFSSDGKIIASGVEDVSLWDVQSGELVQTVHQTFGSHLMAFSPDGKYMAIGGFDYLDDAYTDLITLWDTGTWGNANEMWGHTGHVKSLVFSPDSSLLASGGADYASTNKGEVILWKMPGGQKQCTLNAYANVSSAVISPDGRTVAAAANPGSIYSPKNGKIYLWNLRECTQLRILEEGADALAFSADGTLASVNQKITRWDTDSGQKLGTLPGQTLIAFSPDGKVLASLGERSTQVILVDVQSGKILRTLEGHTEEINTIAFSPDGSMLASAGNDHIIILWGAGGK